MEWEPFGDAAFTTSFPSSDVAAAVAAAIRSAQVTGVRDCWSAFERVMVTVDPLGFEPKWLDGFGLSGKVALGGRLLTIPVCYSMGIDLTLVVGELGLALEDFVAYHSGAEYEALAIGFAPGFAYCGWLPPEITGVPRHSVPRTRVEPGSVAITERYTAVYPSVTPGGWKIIGRTPLVLADEADGYFGISAGDRIRYQPISAEEFEKLRGQRL